MEGVEEHKFVPVERDDLLCCAVENMSADQKSAIKRLLFAFYPGLDKEVQELRRENEELKEEKEKRQSAEKLYLDMSYELSEAKKKLTQAQDYIRTIDECKRTGDPRPSFKYEYNLTDFGEVHACSDAEKVLDVCFELVSYRHQKDKYVIEGVQDIAAVYVVLSKDNMIDKRYKYKGKKTDFCHVWNVNVVGRIEDKKRAQKLKIDNQDAFRVMTTKGICRHNPISWQKLYRETEKGSPAYCRAINIQGQLRKVLA